MLNAFREQLKTMDLDPKDQFASRIRRLAGGRAAPILTQSLRRLILATPAMAGQIRRWTDDANMPQRLQRLHKFALAYLYSPIDFLPEPELGLFGYLDDAFLVGCVYDATRRELSGIGVAPDAEEAGLLSDVAAGLEASLKVLPNETGIIRKLLSEVESGADHRRALELSASIGSGGGRR